MPIPTCPNDAEAAGMDAQALQRIIASVEGDIAQGLIFGATVLVARHGKIALHQSVGTVAPGRNAKNDDLYLSMSLAKSFAAALTLRAIDQGKFTLDTKVAEILPEFASGGKKNITIYQLLSHQAGIYSKLVPPAPHQATDIKSLEKMYQAVASQPVEYVPGERVCYAPFAGHAVCAKILTTLDPKKRSFAQIAADELFHPLAMIDTRYGSAESDPRRVDVSFTEKMTTPSSAATSQFLNQLASEGAEMPAGGAYTTAIDTFRFAETLRRGGSNDSYRLMSPAMVDYASRNHCGELTNDAWISYCVEHDLPQLRANFSLLGGYSRGEGHHMVATGQLASPKSFCAVGGGSTMWMVDPERELSVVFLSAGFIEGLAHFQRVSRINDLALAACL